MYIYEHKCPTLRPIVVPVSVSEFDLPHQQTKDRVDLRKTINAEAVPG